MPSEVSARSILLAAVAVLSGCGSSTTSSKGTPDATTGTDAALPAVDASVPEAAADATPPPRGEAGAHAVSGVLATGLAGGNRIALDTTTVYVAAGESTFNHGQVVSVNKDGTGMRVLASAQVNPNDVAVDDTTVYFTNRFPRTGDVRRVSKDGTGLMVVAASQDNAGLVAVDSTNVYWSTGFGSPGNTGTIVKAAKDGSGQTMLTTGQQNILDMAVDAASVYWLTIQGKELRKVNKDGTRLYTSNTADRSVSVYDLSQDAANPLEIQKVTLKGTGNNFQIQLDSKEEFFYVVSQQAAPGQDVTANSLHVLKMDDEDGTLTEVPSSPTQLPVPNFVRPQGVAAL